MGPFYYVHLQKVMNNMLGLIQGSKLKSRNKNPHRSATEKSCKNSPTSGKNVGKLVSRLKLGGRWDYAGLEIFIVQADGEGESIVRSGCLDDEEESKTATMISIFILPRSVGSFVPQVCW